MESKESLQAVRQEIKERVNNLHIVVNEKPVKVNAVGYIGHMDKEYVVVNNMPEMDLDPDNYDILEIKEDLNSNIIVLFSIQSESLYETLCNMWELWLEEGESNDT